MLPFAGFDELGNNSQEFKCARYTAISCHPYRLYQHITLRQNVAQEKTRLMIGIRLDATWEPTDFAKSWNSIGSIVWQLSERDKIMKKNSTTWWWTVVLVIILVAEPSSQLKKLLKKLSILHHRPSTARDMKLQTELFKVIKSSQGHPFRWSYISAHPTHRTLS